MQILLSSTPQAGPGRKVKQEQEEISRNHVPKLFLGSVHFVVLPKILPNFVDNKLDMSNLLISSDFFNFFQYLFGRYFGRVLWIIFGSVLNRGPGPKCTRTLNFVESSKKYCRLTQDPVPPPIPSYRLSPVSRRRERQ